MNKSFAIVVCLAAVCQGADSGTAAAVEGGTASFVVNTTVPGISVKGNQPRSKRTQWCSAYQTGCTWKR